MEQTDFIPRNRGERIRKRAWQAAQRRDLSAYTKLVALALEVGSIREVGEGLTRE